MIGRHEAEMRSSGDEGLCILVGRWWPGACVWLLLLHIGTGLGLTCIAM